MHPAASGCGLFWALRKMNADKCKKVTDCNQRNIPCLQAHSCQ